MNILYFQTLFNKLLGETEEDRMSILNKVDLKDEEEQEVIEYCKENEAQLSHQAVINLVLDLKRKSEKNDEICFNKHDSYRWWYAFRKKHDLKITAKLR